MRRLAEADEQLAVGALLGVIASAGESPSDSEIDAFVAKRRLDALPLRGEHREQVIDVAGIAGRRHVDGSPSSPGIAT